MQKDQDEFVLHKRKGCCELSSPAFFIREGTKHLVRETGFLSEPSDNCSVAHHQMDFTAQEHYININNKYYYIY